MDPLAIALIGIVLAIVVLAPVGTGQALKNAQNCDGDVLFVHARPAEEKFVQAGFGVERLDVMYNDFVIVGPGTDPAKVDGVRDASAALQMIAEAKAKGYGNALVADAIGNVAESASANVFMVKDGEVFTPAPNGTFLAGITRARHIRNLRADGVAAGVYELAGGDIDIEIEDWD